MEQDPAWHVPESIREESARAGKLLPSVVPAGPRNPLGRFWIGLSLASIGIHGTPFPSSIYQTATHGCIRLQADNIADLYSHVRVGTRGRIIYEPVLLAREGVDAFVEVHEDVYRRMPATAREHARELAASLGVIDQIDWTAADLEIERRGGVARQIRLRPSPAQ
jgi:L,D-transpeptidase ErfK/SrfK